MPLDFFSVACKTTSNKDCFGLCDDPSPAKNPAYIDENDPSKWIATVDNKSNKTADFYAIDHCLIILKPDGINLESRCDGMLNYDNNLIFVELKDRAHHGWLLKGSSQLTITINKFREIHTSSAHAMNKAYVCNKQRPLAITGNNTVIQKFKDDTGLLLRAQPKITI